MDSTENSIPTSLVGPQAYEQNGGKHQIVWRNVASMSYLHLSGLYGIYLCISGQVFLRTFIFQFLLVYLANFGTTAGVHRLWSHKSYKATLPFRILLMLAQTLACQNSIHEWARDHRAHHKYTDTNADPHNSKRGFFFCHIGWILVQKHEDLKTKGKNIDISDLENDSVVMFQKKFFKFLALLICFVGPWYVPIRMWGENWWVSWNLVLLRYTFGLNITWCVNSFAHLWGHKPYDKHINPTESKVVTILTAGEGWHNYHHTFPWDYKAAELPNYLFNWTTGLIDFFAWIGWAYDMKTVSEKVIFQRVQRTGDGSHSQNAEVKLNGNGFNNGNSTNEIHSWGWDDVDLRKEDKEVAIVLNRSV
ncbi:unnamed protein product [Orchesella dallaii]|uniref:Fatty acid desaturase domain-containing protein n=1 Tax=Orchesella dallaii TaxID=48710 RepID=A0ABP1S741_9HEXA